MVTADSRRARRSRDPPPPGYPGTPACTRPPDACPCWWSAGVLEVEGDADRAASGHVRCRSRGADGGSQRRHVVRAEAPDAGFLGQGFGLRFGFVVQRERQLPDAAFVAVVEELAGQVVLERRRG